MKEKAKVTEVIREASPPKTKELDKVSLNKESHSDSDDESEGIYASVGVQEMVNHQEISIFLLKLL